MLNGAHIVMPHTSFDAHLVLLLIEVAKHAGEKSFLTCQLWLLLDVPIPTNDTVIPEIVKITVLIALPSHSIFFNFTIEWQVLRGLPTAGHWFIPKIILFLLNQKIFCVCNDIWYVVVVHALIDVSSLLLIKLREVLDPRRNIRIELSHIGHGGLILPLFSPEVKHGVPPQVEEASVLHPVYPHSIGHNLDLHDVILFLHVIGFSRSLT